VTTSGATNRSFFHFALSQNHRKFSAVFADGPTSNF
jgi:hypothetical protein